MHDTVSSQTVSPQSLSPITRLELPLCRVLNSVRSRFLLGLFSAVSWLGNGVFWVGVAVLLLATQGPAALPTIRHLFLALAVGLTLYKLLKRCMARPRPFAIQPDIRRIVDPLDEFGFPSGHTVHAVAFTLVLYVHTPLVFWLVLPFTVLVAMSRIVLGLHYPSDVVAGAAVGCVAALAALRI